MKGFLLLSILYSITCFGENSERDSLISLLPQEKLDTSKINLLLQISDTYKDVDSNIYYKKKALKISEQQNLTTTPQIVGEIIEVFKTSNQFNKIIDFGLPYYLKYQKENDQHNKLTLSSQIGYAYYAIGKSDSAVSYYNYVIKTANDTIKKERSLKAGVLRQRASIFIAESIYDKAIIDLENAITLVDTSNYYTLYSIYATIADAYTQFGDYDKALLNFNKANSFVDKTEAFLPKMHILYSYADFYRVFKNFEKSNEYALKGVKLAEENNEPYGLMIFKSLLAKTYIDLKQYDKAKPHLEYVVKQGTMFQANELIAIAKYDLGTIANYNKNYKQALSYCNEAWRFFKETQNYIHKASTCSCLSDANQGLGNNNKALFYYKKAVAFKDSTNSEEQIKKTYRIQNKYELEKKEVIHKAKQKQQQLIAEQKLKTKNQFILGISIFFLLIISLVFLIFKSLQRKKETRYLIEKEKSQTKFSQDLIQFQEDEKIRIARELHDSVGQDLILLKTKAVANKNEELETLIGVTLDNVRSITQNLHPFVLEKFGITTALKKLVKAIDESTDLFISDEIEDIDGILDKTQELNTYRIVQEALNNVLKHANSPSVLISTTKKTDFIEVIVKDHGKGFDWNEKSALKNSLGMKTLEERAKIINATLNITSEINKGTIIHLKIPIQNA